MTDTLLHMPAPPDQRITTLHAWIGVHDNGGEGIISVDLEVPEIGMRHVPLLSSKRDVALRMGRLASKAAQMSRTTDQPVARIELRTFVMAEAEPNAA